MYNYIIRYMYVYNLIASSLPRYPTVQVLIFFLTITSSACKLLCHFFTTIPKNKSTKEKIIIIKKKNVLSICVFFFDYKLDSNV